MSDSWVSGSLSGSAEFFPWGLLTPESTSIFLLVYSICYCNNIFGLIILNVCIGISYKAVVIPPKKVSQDKQMKILWRKCKFATLTDHWDNLEHRKAEQSKASNKFEFRQLFEYYFLKYLVNPCFVCCLFIIKLLLL